MEHFACLDNAVRKIDLNTQTDQILGNHESGLRALVYSDEDRVLYSGGWDSVMQAWDPRSQGSIGSYPQSGRIFDMDVTRSSQFDDDSSQPMIVLATSDRKVLVYDRRMLSKTFQVRESPLRYMTRVVKCLPNGEGFAISSIEGRIAVEYFDPSDEAQAKKFAFKCHRQNLEGEELVYPVNAIEFHPTNQMTFASGGADGAVNIWDGSMKKRIRSLPRQATSISSLSFSSDGTKLAIAVSYTFEEGEKDHPPDTILIRNISDNDIRPKSTVRKSS